MAWFTVHLDQAAQEFFPQNGSLTLPMYDSALYAPSPEMGYQYHVLPPAFELPPTLAMPTRVVLLIMVPPSTSESTVRRELEILRDVRLVKMERWREVHLYNVNDARAARAAIQEHHEQQLRLEAVANNYMGYAPPPATPPPMAPGLISGRADAAKGISELIHIEIAGKFMVKGATVMSNPPGGRGGRCRAIWVPRGRGGLGGAAVDPWAGVFQAGTPGMTNPRVGATWIETLCIEQKEN